MTVDLIRKLARMKEQNCETEPELWYKDAYGHDADYADLLEEIGKTPADRRAILRRYFEANEEERLRGEKLPTEGHKHIAELVSKGYIRVIVTTNFDHLIEDALRGLGIEPVIISTPDAVLGAPPLSHANPLIVKAHGDYLDARLKNTGDELSHYEEPLDRLLDRIFDEFGLIVCGWSATWNVAMRNALERCKGHRFTTYWTQKGPLTDESMRLMGLRLAQVIEIESADSFFCELSAKVFSLEEIGKRHPLEAKVAVSTLKNYLQDGHSEIRLHDLIVGETEHLYERLVERKYPVSERTPGYDPPNDASRIAARVERYEADSEVLVSLFITGCYWGGREQEGFWWKCLERIANPAMDFPNPYSGVWYRLRRYPALLLLYGGGVAATARRRYSTLVKLFTLGAVADIGTGEKRFLVVVNPTRILDEIPEHLVKEVFGAKSVYGASNRLARTLRDPFRGLLSQDSDYDDAFDRFEHFLALVYADIAPEMARAGRPSGAGDLGKEVSSSRLQKKRQMPARTGHRLRPDCSGGRKRDTPEPFRLRKNPTTGPGDFDAQAGWRRAQLRGLREQKCGVRAGRVSRSPLSGSSFE